MSRQADADVALKFNEWMRRTAMAASINCFGDGRYSGEEGAWRLAHECGPALLDFGEYGIENIGATYSAICVIAYQLKPPVDAKAWFRAMRDGYEKAKATDKRQVAQD